MRIRKTPQNPPSSDAEGAKKSAPKKSAPRAKVVALFVAVEAAAVSESFTETGLIRKGEIAEQGSEILREYPQYFKPLEIKYKA